MAGRWCSVVWLLSFLLIYILNTSYAHISDAENKYLAYAGNIGNTQELVFKPQVRLRRDDAVNEKENNGEKPTAMGKKPTLPAKNPKVGKVSSAAKSKLLLKKMTTADSPLVETPSSVTTSSNATSTTNTTITTTTTTTTSSPTTINSVPISTSAATDTTPPVDEANSKNSTGGAMPAEMVPESTTAPNIPRNDTEISGVVTETETSVKSIDGDKVPEVDDPDTGDDFLTPINGYVTGNTTVDHHRYYKSVTVKGDDEAQQYWVNLDVLNEEKVVTNQMLSDSHRRAATVTLTFDFPFYGHMLRNITIATGGFLFTGDFVHTWLAATQYIAPLMANFDTSVSKDACVKYADNGTAFTVQWDKVRLKDHQDAGTFTFQVTLHQTGDIMFTYKQIPVTVTSIGDDQHPVKVGLSDAYIVDRTIFYVRRKTIYEYHKIDMKKSSLIGNWTAILFQALPTCMPLNSCEACLSTNINFQCMWCNKIGRCSTGLDRHRQDWLYNGCEAKNVQDSEKCVGLIPPPIISPSGNSSVDTFGPSASVEPYSKAPGTPVLDASEYKEGIVSDGEPDTLAHTSGRDAGEGDSSVGGVVTVIFLLGLVVGIVGWVAYAYFYPHSTSGQIFIKYRPSTWAWRRGEARYTAAAIHSIHM